MFKDPGYNSGLDFTKQMAAYASGPGFLRQDVAPVAAVNFGMRPAPAPALAPS